MLPSARTIKKSARELLSAYYFGYITACLPFIFSLGIIMLVSGVLYSILGEFPTLIIELLLFVFLLTPLFMGTIRFFRRRFENSEDLVSSVFYYYSNGLLYIKCIRFVLSVVDRLVLSGVMLSIPAIIIGFFSTSFFYQLIGFEIPIWAPILSTVSSLLFGLAVFLFIFVNLKYYLCFYLFVINDDMTAKKAMDFSRTISRRTQIDFIYLGFNMIIYILLSLFFLPLIFTLPMLIAVYILHSKYVVLQYNATIDSLL